MKYTIAVVIAILASACSLRTERPQSVPNQTEPVVVEQQENAKYKLTTIFYGERLSDGADAPFTHIALRDDTTGEELVYEPEEPFNRNNVWNVWSPDGEFLLLMRGDFKGVCIIKASEAKEEFRRRSCYDYIMVYEKNTTTGLMHTSGLWTSNDEFRFSAGLSGDMWLFSYKLKTRELKVEGPNRNFEGQNRHGKVPLSVG